MLCKNRLFLRGKKKKKSCFLWSQVCWMIRIIWNISRRDKRMLSWILFLLCSPKQTSRQVLKNILPASSKVATLPLNNKNSLKFFYDEFTFWSGVDGIIFDCFNLLEILRYQKVVTSSFRLLSLVYRKKKDLVLCSCVFKILVHFFNKNVDLSHNFYSRYSKTLIKKIPYRYSKYNFKF